MECIETEVRQEIELLTHNGGVCSGMERGMNNATPHDLNLAYSEHIWVANLRVNVFVPDYSAYGQPTVELRVNGGKKFYPPSFLPPIFPPKPKNGGTDVAILLAVLQKDILEKPEKNNPSVKNSGVYYF